MEKEWKMDKQYWRSMWLSSIAELTNLDLQIEKWLDASNANPHWGYVEFMCCYFDDVFQGRKYEDFLSDGWISEAEYDCVKDWHELLDAHKAPNNENYNDLAIVNDLEWRRIVAIGVIAKEQLIKLLPSDEASQLRS
ncbi:hypothetical protein [Hymenobacter lapidiphilus]|uniref:Uncharacterized protein n=1 Tax=Hymenobacter lapidiphilus TaxID=2608003 RepID=A0A7Y7PMU0_9BACT|nr:hypothetical protein [Hymenobacter lapidiphilus]NVO30731.1 hypothetical protein [Hymenobacter lapidiphilus]